MLTEIFPFLYVSSETDITNFEPPNEGPCVFFDLTKWRFDLDWPDDSLHDQLLELIISIDLLRNFNIPVIVYCQAGQDRAPFLVACYLFVFSNIDFPYHYVASKHTDTILHEDWWTWFKALRGG